MTGLPSLPLCLKESLKSEKKKSKTKGKEVLSVNSLERTDGRNTRESLNANMAELRDMDCQLFHQLWALYDTIQEHKQSCIDRLSETNSECSSVISYNLDSQLETIPDFQEHVYVNDKFHQHIYVNQSFHEGGPVSSSNLSEREAENMYEPVYVEHDTQVTNGPTNGKEEKRVPDPKPCQVERSSSRSSMSSTSSNRSKRFSGVFTQTTYESSC